ncbi:hypothetical protein ACIQWN_32215 [Streptomyces vinaceus]|uniref:hypothetical protein n=1 Tax=Streptomyces vinaceus TaxID=1960 RepID=UPI00380D06AF
MAADTRLAERDPFWQQQIDKHVASRGQHADPSACGTCRAAVKEGKPVEDDGCAQRAMLIQPPDMPCWEVLTKMTEQEKADLPARFHLPVFDSCGKPNAWLCTVCWGDGWSTVWPCATAVKHGTQVFTPDHEATQHQERLRIDAADVNRALNETLRERDFMHHMADRLAYAVAPIEVIGEHSSGNCPWENALDHVTSIEKADGMRSRIAELESTLAERTQQLNGLLDALAFDEKAVPR